MKRVEFKVRQNALLLREFTIAQLVRATGLDQESVQTEVERLGQEGFVTSELKPEQYDILYRLSDDPEKRLALSRGIEAFYPELPEPTYPTSRLYQAALQSLAQAEGEKGRRREELLAEAARQLEGAWQAEGASLAPKLVQGHILRERGRLARLEGRHEQARELFNISFEETTSIMRQRLQDHLQTTRNFLEELESLLNVYQEYRHNVQLLRRGAAAAADAADGDHQPGHGSLDPSSLPCDDPGAASA